MGYSSKVFVKRGGESGRVAGKLKDSFYFLLFFFPEINMFLGCKEKLEIEGGGEGID